jgi:nonribosomal peptide synthetase DhbF
MVHREGLSGPAEDEDEQPQGEMEQLIVSVWADVLNAEATSRYDDFFLLGGSSMSAVHVSAELTGRLGFKVPPRTIYEYTELADLARRLTELQASATDSHR